VATDGYDVFISYNRADARFAADIDSVMRQKGLRTFFDRRNLDDRFHETSQLHLGLSIHEMRPFRASHMIRTLEALD
jgi:hypothetical protein